ncbi:hypothetical protein H4R20_002439 [Coemansia guatemalensis]|uniref:Enoyl reductase (ER) domain-containing protein n=1 Tax=Coemansia guatemalensis TaxID=2761395 RepID=A0A9W8I1F7_9FUNG|nr:hypothetical protein H4R20_002439 [Coemansia guatemalensis]
MATMKAVVFKRPYKVDYEDAERPCNPQPGEAIVRVHACGLCGSDLHPYRGTEAGLQAGTVCGHEFAGVVEEVGSGVQLSPGDRVAASFTTACGNCWYCAHSISSRCDHAQLFGWVGESGKGIHGAQAQFVRVPHANGTLMKLPSHISFEEGVLLGDIFATGYFCAKNALVMLSDSGIPPAELSVAVIGCGPVGLCAVASARMLGFGSVFAVDRVQNRIDAAVKLGALDQDPTTANQGRGVDAVLEVVGSYDALKLGFRLVRTGGAVSSVGVHAHDKGFPVSPDDCYNKNISFRSGRCPARSLMDEISELLKTTGIVSCIISHQVPLAAAPEMYEMFEAQRDKILKVIFDPWA